MSIRMRRLLGGTAGIAGGAFAAATASADVPQVATDIAPVHSLVARVMEGLGEPSLVVRPGASPHGYALRPSEAHALSQADAVFWIGPELEPWLEGAIENLAPDAATVALLEVPETDLLEFRTGATFASHAHDREEREADADADHPADGGEHGHDDTHEDAHDHAQEGHDPHAWLDPENGKVWLDAIAQELSRLDPENAAAYASSAEAGKAEIDAVQAEIGALLAPARGMRFVVFHDAYNYFESRFDIPAAGAISLSDASDPSPARVEEVRDTVRNIGASCVFSEPQFNQSLVRTVTDGTEARSGVIDPLGAGVDPGPAFYVRFLQSVAEELADCAG